MAAWKWLRKVKNLTKPSLVTLAQHNALAEAVKELQAKSLTSIKCDDKTVAISIKQGEATISGARSTIVNLPAAGAETPVPPAGPAGTVPVVVSGAVVWADPVLKYQPVTLHVAAATAGKFVTIDTAEDCT